MKAACALRALLAAFAVLAAAAEEPSAFEAKVSSQLPGEVRAARPPSAAQPTHQLQWTAMRRW